MPFLLIFFLSFYSSLFAPVSTDQAWFLQVVNRVSSGELLYRDTFFGTFPLSIWIATLLCKLTGVEIITLRLINSLAIAGSIKILSNYLESLNVKRKNILLYELLSLVLFPAHIASAGSCYSQLAFFGLSAFFYYLQKMHLHNTLKHSIYLGLFTTLTLFSKHNVGIYLLIVLPALFWVRSIKLMFLLSCVLVPCCSLIGFFLYLNEQNILPDFLNHTFYNKLTYLTNAHISPLQGFSDTILSNANRSIWDMQKNYLSITYIILALSFILIIMLLRLNYKKFSTLAIFFFLAFISIYPRIDIYHLVFLSPWICLVTTLGFEEKVFRFDKLFKLTLWTTIIFGFSFFTIKPTYRLIMKNYNLSKTKYFSYLFLTKNAEDTYTAINKVVLENFSDDNKVFLLRGDMSGFIYLLGNLQNPTIYDFPYSSTFGKTGQAQVIAAIKSGEIKKICFAPANAGKLSPTELEKFVQEELTLIQKTEIGGVYSLPLRSLKTASAAIL